jgi:hypothetical protein
MWRRIPFFCVIDLAALRVRSSVPSGTSSGGRRCGGGLEQLRHPGEQRSQRRRGFRRRLDDQSAAGGTSHGHTGDETLDGG